MKLIERDIEIDFTDALDAFVFDQMVKTLPKYHGIGQMHRVDFIVDMPDYVAYVEIKDPVLRPEYPDQARQFLNEVNDGSLGLLFAEKLKATFIYGWAEEKALKPIRYLSLVLLETPMTLILSESILRRLPPTGKPKMCRWKRPFLTAVGVFNLDTWNENFPNWPARRIASIGGQR